MGGDREADGVRKAKDRLVGIKRAWDSVAASVDAAEQRVVKKIAELSDEIDHLNDRYSQSVKVRAEAAALSDRFNLPKLTCPDVAPPARRDVAVVLTTLPQNLLASAWGNQPTEEDEFQMRTRRIYTEAAGTPGAEIIEAAGLKPFPELTERQREILEAKEREKEQMRKQFAALPQIPQGGNVPLGSL
jgi:thymidylate kinase